MKNGTGNKNTDFSVSVGMPHKSKEGWNLWNRRRYAENTQAYHNFKETTPCADCQNCFPHYVMEFDHVPGQGEKRKNVAALVGSRKLTAPTVTAELAKCDLVCANCHKIRTHTRGQQRKNTAI